MCRGRCLMPGCRLVVWGVCRRIWPSVWPVSWRGGRRAGGVADRLSGGMPPSSSVGLRPWWRVAGRCRRSSIGSCILVYRTVTANTNNCNDIGIFRCEVGVGALQGCRSPGIGLWGLYAGRVGGIAVFLGVWGPEIPRPVETRIDSTL